MSVKYIVLTYTIFTNILRHENSEFCEKYGKYFYENKNNLHIPVDSYIIEAVWHAGIEETFDGKIENRNEFRQDKLLVPIPLKDKIKEDKRINKYSSDYAKGWSIWKDTEYDGFQQGLKSVINNDMEPLDWENENWIKIANRRKKK